MVEWVDTPFREIVHIETGNLDSNQAVESGQYPFFTCSPETLRIDTYAFDTEAVLLAGNNANGIFPVKYYKGKFNAYQRTYVITPRDSQLLDCIYLYYQIQLLTHQLREFSIGTATRFLTRGILDDLLIPLPPLLTQHAIARILGTLDDKIELNRQMNATLEAMARAIFQSWFVDFDPVRAKAEGRQPAGMDAATAALFPSEFEEVDGREVPRGWGVETLDEIAENIRRPINPDQVDPDTPYIGLEHMPQRSIALCEWGSASTVESGKFAFRKNEFLFGKLRPYFHKVGIAPVDGVCSTDILIINPKNDSWASYVMCCISSNEFVEFANQGSDGTKMPRSSWSAMKKYQIVIPSKDIIVRFNSSILPLFENINANIHESRTLAQIRDALLPKLMSGEIRIDNNLF